MTFGEFILKLRERLNDIRQADVSLITTADQDGRRWTSARLITISNDALLEGMRLIALYSKSPVMEQLAGDLHGVIAYSVLDAPTISGLVATTPLPTDSIAIIELIGNLSSEYHYIKPTAFTAFLSDTTLLSRTDKVFTILYDTATSTKMINILNYVEGEVITGTYLICKSNYTVDDIDDEFFVRGLDDLFLDIAERNARDIEHHWDRSNVLDRRIMFKFGISVGGQN